MLYEFDCGRKAAVATTNICSAYGPDALTERTCQRWFERFRAGNRSLEDEARSGRPPEVDEARLLALVKDQPKLTPRELAKIIGCCPKAVSKHLAAMRVVQKFGEWVPHELSDEQKVVRSTICQSNLSRERKEPFLARVVAEDEKWVLYANRKRKRQWVLPGCRPQPEPKPDLHPMKIMVCVWWDMKGIVHWELLPRGTTIDADYYCEQLERVQDALRKRRPALVNRRGVILLHDNAKAHIAKKTRDKIRELDWELLPHPPYSPDISPSDYHLFRALSRFLGGQRFTNEDEVKMTLGQFFDSQTPDFYECGILSLTRKWSKVVECDGDYFED